jgi:microcystin-dependent protein
MPSTYSTALRLELIGNGEQAANWGNTTNTNLGTLLEQAITGVSTITMTDANYTLVSGNGISDQARNAVVIMSGTLTATRNVVVPTSNKFYAVRNATTGGQSILVKTSAGTGVTLANGFTQLMYCDGTNVVLASVPINSSNGNVAVPGTLAVTSNTTVGGDLAVTGTITQGGGSIFPAGIIWEYGGSSAPTGWLLCDGSAVSRTTYAALFAVLGTAYGSGDGSTTFNVPDKRGKFGIGVDGTYTRGSTGGAASGTTSTAGSHNHTGNTGSTTLSTSQIPSHTHSGTTDSAGNHTHGTSGGGGESGIAPSANYGNTNNYILTGGGTNQYNTSTAGAHTHTFTTGAAGGGTGHDHSISTDGSHTHTVATVPPYLASNFIIKT